MASALDAEVELAFLQKYSRPSSKRSDARENTIEKCPEYMEFLCKREEKDKEEEKETPSIKLAEAEIAEAKPPVAAIVEFLARRHLYERLI